MNRFTSTASEFPPQDSLLDLDVSDFAPPGEADGAFWWDFMGQHAVNESEGILACNQFTPTFHHGSASTNDASLNDPCIDTFEHGAMDFGNVDVGDITTINDASHHGFSINNEERLSGYQVPESNQTLWFGHTAPNIDASTSLFPASVDTLGTSGPASFSLPVKNPFVSVSEHSSGPIDLSLSEDPWLHSLVQTNERALSPCCDTTSGITHTQQQSSTVLDDLMVSPNLLSTTHSQQSSVPFICQDYDMDISSGLGYSADTDLDFFHSNSGYVSTTPFSFDLPIRAVGFEHRRDSLRCDSSYSRATSQHVNSSFGTNRSCFGLPILGLESNTVVNDNYKSSGDYPVPLDASSNSLVQYANGAPFTASTSDVV